MSKEIVKGPLGKIGDYDVQIKEGKLELTLNADVVGGSVGVVVKIESCELLDLIAKAIPGTIDDAIVNIAKEALKKI